MSVPGARIWIAGMGALLLLACTACGFKGPLYLPERNATVITRPAQAAQEAPSSGQTSPGQTSPGQTQTPAAKSKSKTSQPPSSSRAPAPQSSPSPPQ